MENFYTFSVIIPTYNPGTLICETLDSLVAQTYKNFEVIISDDGSTDNTLNLVEAYREKLNIKVLKNPNWGGPARPRNIGIKNANSEWIAFLDHDDTWEKNKLETVFQFIKNFDVIFHDLIIFNKKGNTSKRVKGRDLGNNPFIKLLTHGNAIANSSAVVRKKIIEDVGYIDESIELMAVEDYDLWLKIAQNTNRFHYLNLDLGFYRLEPGQNMTAANEKQIARYNCVYNKYLPMLKSSDQNLSRTILAYSNARIYHKLKNYKDAKINYLQALKAPRLDIKIKAILGLGLIWFKSV